ncbi:hypothetical protein ACOT81_38575 [Streptomyces sp. WI04-05B]|uniref:hypothetical protein n=1 Tax=Streptomyces TaxID=1883 RepID=UPI0029A87A3D|nr:MULTISPECIES: hypothetical protein [Streptomyces]MDX2547505.1 hypothetical protein [Streptomyces sp. WI04-05B]MDX2589898.1 hypothetical protein [Streptomyces sp. WI04-05A]
MPRFHTDGKSDVLLTSFSLPLAVLVTAVPGHTLPRASAVLVGAGVVGLVAAMLVAPARRAAVSSTGPSAPPRSC